MLEPRNAKSNLCMFYKVLFTFFCLLTLIAPITLPVIDEQIKKIS